MPTSEERIRKLRQEVQSLRDLLVRTRKSREEITGKKDGKPAPNKPKNNPKIKPKPDDDIPPF